MLLKRLLSCAFPIDVRGAGRHSRKVLVAEIIEWDHKYVYLFNAFSYANRETVCSLMALSKEDNKSIPQPNSMRDKLKHRAETGKCPIFQGFEVKFCPFCS